MTAPLTHNAEAVLQQLVPLAQRVAAQLATEPNYPRSFALDILGRPTLDDGRSLGVALHLAAGGDISDLLPDTDDDLVTSTLVEMTIDSYPLLIAPADPSWPTPRVSLYRHPRRTELEAAIQGDATLAKLFPEDDPGIGRRGYFYSSLGRGGSIQNVMFGEMMVTSAWNIAEMTTGDPNLRSLVNVVRQNLKVLRRGIDNKQPVIPTRMVFTGFTTRGGETISTPWGSLRPIKTWERDHAPTSLESDVIGTQHDGTQVKVSHAGEMILETDLPYTIIPGKTPDWTDVPAPWPNIKGADVFRRRLEGVQLAVLLATDRPIGSWITARLAWSWVGDPYGYGPGMSWSDRQSAPGFMPHELSPEECTEVARWAALIESSWTPRIDIAVRRILSAANSRTDMADRLVDSVIVWENLFGTTQGEPRLRISAAMAWLLESDPTKREELQLKLKALYDDRSRIVHGGKPDEKMLGEQANSALHYARDALRALFSERPDILTLTDGATRSLRLLMGG
jgi:Apea-like HEPN